MGPVDSESLPNRTATGNSAESGRRKFLKAVGGASIVAMTAGCVGDSGDSGETSTTTTTDTDSTETTDTPPSEPQYGGHLRVAIRRPPRTLNPIFASVDVSSFQIMAHMFDGYAPYDYGENQNVPGLLTEWEWIDNVTLEGKVREGVQFHKGYGELTAEDMVYKTNRILEDKLPELWLYTGLIDNAEQVDKYRVRWNFNQPYVPFVWSVLGTSRVGSKKAIEEMGDEEYGRNPIGTGPFVFDEWQEGSFVRLTKNDEYWQEDLPYLDQITYRFVPEASTQLNMLKNGEIDALDRTSYKDIPEVRNSEEIKLEITSPGWNFGYMSVGGRQNDRDELKDPKVRKAINYAINRTAIAQNAFNGFANPDDDPLPADLEERLPGDPIEVYPNEPDVEMAQQLLAEAGFDDGIDVELIHDPATEVVRAAQIIASSLGQAGINVELNQLEGTAVVDRSNNGTFEMIYGSIDLGYPDPDAAIYHFLKSDGASNDIAYANDKVDELLVEERKTTDVEERMGMIKEAIITYLNDSPGYVYCTHRDAVRAMRNNVYIEGTLAPQQHLLNFNRAWKSQ